MSSPLLSLAQLLATLRVLLWSREGALPRVSSLDGVHWQCVAVDPDTGEVRDDVSSAVSERSAEDAAALLLQRLHEEGLRADATVPDVRTLRDPFPTATLADGTAPYTVQCDPAELGADGRATDDVAEVA